MTLGWRRERRRPRRPPRSATSSRSSAPCPRAAVDEPCSCHPRHRRGRGRRRRRRRQRTPEPRRSPAPPRSPSTGAPPARPTADGGTRSAVGPSEGTQGRQHERRPRPATSTGATPHLQLLLQPRSLPLQLRRAVHPLNHLEQSGDQQAQVRGSIALPHKHRAPWEASQPTHRGQRVKLAVRPLAEDGGATQQLDLEAGGGRDGGGGGWRCRWRGRRARRVAVIREPASGCVCVCTLLLISSSKNSFSPAARNSLTGMASSSDGSAACTDAIRRPDRCRNPSSPKMSPAPSTLI